MLLYEVFEHDFEFYDAPSTSYIASPELTEAEKLEISQYMTSPYGLEL